MRPTTLLALALALPLAARAQGPSPAKPQPAATAATAAESRFLGTWEGSYSSHGPSGTMRLVVARDSASAANRKPLTATLTTTGEPPLTPGEPADLEVRGDALTWSQSLMGMACSATAAVDAAGALRGEMSCGHGALTFVMLRK